MGWLFYSLTTVVLFALWSVLGKVALRTATPVQTTILYGVAAALVAVVAIGFGQRTAGWSVSVLWVGVLSALCGALGLLTFYLALDRGSASLAVPVIGFYPQGLRQDDPPEALPVAQSDRRGRHPIARAGPRGWRRGRFRTFARPSCKRELPPLP